MANKKTNAAVEPNKNSRSTQAGIGKTSKIIIAIAAVLIILLLAGSVVLTILNSDGYTQRKQMAYKVGDNTLTVAEYNYYYYSEYYNIISNSTEDELYVYGLDISEDAPPLTEQYVESEFTTEELEFSTWDEYFRLVAEDAISRTYASIELSEQDENFTIPEDVYSLADEYIDKLKASAKQSGVTFRKYLENVFGPGATEELVKTLNLRSQIANAYNNYISEKFDITEEMINEAYEENRVTLDLISYRAHYVPYSYSNSIGVDSESADSQTEETSFSINEAMEKFEDLVAEVESEEDFKQIVLDSVSDADREKYTKDDPTLHENERLDSISIMEAEAWLASYDRKSGDAGVVQAKDGVYLTYFISREPNSEPTVSFRDILILPNSDISPSAGMSNTQIAEATATAEQILDEYNSGSTTEDRFSMMASQYSADEYTNQYGGLVTSYFAGQSFPEMDEWLFDEKREEGDTTIISSEYGVYILYYIEEGDAYWKEECKSIAKSNALNSVLEEKAKTFDIANLEYYDKTGK